MSPAGWTEANLGDVVDTLDRLRIPVNETERSKRVGAVPYYGATGQVGWIDGHLFDEELVLLGEDGAPFLDSGKPKAYIIRGKSWVNNHAHVLRAAGGISNAFIAHQLNIVDYRSFVSGTTRLKLPQAPMRRVPLVIAPLPEQHRIVAEIEKQLTRLDASLAALERVRGNLKRYRAATLSAACGGRLVPTEAELARAEGREYESAHFQLERLGIAHSLCSIEGWACASVGDLATLVQYGTSAKTSGATVGVPVVRMGNIVSGRLVLDQLKYLPPDHSEFPDLLLEPGDLLFNRTNSAELVGKSAVFRAFATPHSFASYLIRVRLSNAFLPDLLAYYLNSTLGRGWIRTVVSQQVGQANVNGSKLKSLVLTVPPFAEQLRIVAEVERRLSFVEKLEAVVYDAQKRAAVLRQSILKRAFGGKLVPQDSDDEPADVLLERIRAERAAISVNGKVPQRAGRKKVRA